ncbi:MAG: PLP-dependent aminotransferase family protein [Undibacterium sp.]|nr:PLP-dependent aminotransferase family protein [Undibacterium sp.]
MHMSLFLGTLQLDRASAIPLFRQLYLAVKQAILDRLLPAGMQLPPSRELCQSLAISRQTVLNAYELLLAEGYLSGTVGRGTFVSVDLPREKAKRHSEKFVSQISKQISEQETITPRLSKRGMQFVDRASLAPRQQNKTRAFRVSMPGLDVFPFDVWSRLAARRWRHHDDQLGYGDPAGYVPLRELLSVYLKAARGVVCSPEQIIITSGSQQALYLLSTVLLDPDEAAWVESPGYRGAIEPLQAAQAKVCHVPVDREGLNVEYGARHYPSASLVYCTPSHQLPLGMSMSLQRRLALLAWAKERAAWIIEDDYDSEYRYSGAPLASLQSLDKNDSVIYVGTMSKVLFPALRLGYMVLPPALVAPLTHAKSIVDRHTAILPQMVLADFIAEGHFGRHIKRTRKLYSQRQAALLNGIQIHLSHELDCGAHDGGLDLAVHFRKKLDETCVVKAGLDAGLELRPLSYFFSESASSESAPFSPGLLLGFSSITEEEIHRSCLALRKVLRAMC